MSVLDSFHPAVRTWFQRTFESPTEAQEQGWPEIMAGRDTLITAPTGSGKTLAAFLVAIDTLMRQAEVAPLLEQTEVVYVSPLKALSTDIQRNLEEPLAEIAAIAEELGYSSANIRTMLRTGDTTQRDRQQIVKHPPHMLITTPESLYLMLTAQRSRETLRNVKTVIVDEIHALVRDKRGSHLSLTLARLDHVCGGRAARIGLSATIKPLDYAARFLVGSGVVDAEGEPECAVVDAGHKRDLDIAIEVPSTDLEAVCPAPQWADTYDKVADLIRDHQTTLVFVNTRRLAERVAHNLSERLGEEHVASHHGSLSKERRQNLERRLKAGELKALVATASLELGIDIGSVDLVVQLESPRSMTTFLQRVGRSGHALAKTPKGRLFPTTRDELIECAALVRAVREGRLDKFFPPVAPLDILAQQIVAECACEPWDEAALFELVKKATPYASLTQEQYDDIIEMMSEGILVGSGRAASYLHRDRINGVLHGKRGARMTAIMSGGAIPDVADYRVLAEPDGTFVGTLDEDFSIESMAGDIFLLGTTSWLITRIEPGIVRVANAHGAPPSVPFWLGEAPARTRELSEEVSSLRREVAQRIGDGDKEAAMAWLGEHAGLPAVAAEQVSRYVKAQKDSIGVVPSDTDVVFERFFDDSGGMQLVVHAPFGGRINRGLGLALRKNFCRTFDFELQAAATDDAVLLSTGPQHSFPLEDMFHLIRPRHVRDDVEQSILYVPMFGTRWRWNATRALAIPRMRNGKKVPPPIQRMRSDDLLASVFPAQVGCQENLTGPIDLPDHPLVKQTVHDCLNEVMDIEGLEDVVQKMASGEIRLHAKDTMEPSPFSHEMLNSKPYSFLDNAPLEERRARAITLRRTLPESARDLGRLDEEAIERVQDEAWPEPRDPEEVHETIFGFVASLPVGDWTPWFDALVDAGRAATVETAGGSVLWFAAERLPMIEALYPSAAIRPELRLPPELRVDVTQDAALVEMLRGHMECLGTQGVDDLVRRTGMASGRVASGMAQLEGEGIVLRGHFRGDDGSEEFCDRRLLARIHRYTLDRLRREIEPVSAQDLLRFLLRWQHVGENTQVEGKRGLLEAIAQLQGFEAPVVAWERHILPARVANYRPGWLDDICLSGDVTWARLSVKKPASNGQHKNGSATSSSSLISLAQRGDLPWLMAGMRNGEAPDVPARGAAHDVLELLGERGALFYDDVVSASGRLPGDVERGLWELVARGLVTADGFQALRSLMSAGKRRPLRQRQHKSKRFKSLSAGVPAGRWSLLPSAQDDLDSDELAEAWAEQLLFRYGVVFRDLMQRESVSIPWREILRALRRMEARGTVRGGRFVAGFYGEQYARPEAVEMLRRARRTERPDQQTHVSAVDPLNLAGILTPGAKIPAIHTNVVLYKDGLPSLAGVS